MGIGMTSERARRRFHEVFAPYLDDAYSLAKWLAGQGSDAEDIVQEAAIRALAALERAEVVKPKAWTLAIIRNTALTYLARKNPGALAFVGDIDDLEALEFAFDAAPNAEQILIAEQTGARVRDAIAALPSPLKETLIMREINELDYKEIAEATSAPIGTVMSRLARARAAIARALKDLR
jgi:RNA polymerase sigma-70 factor (ECF subfamily)